MTRPMRILAIIMISMSASGAYAQENNSAYPRHNSYSIAVFAGELGYDAGVGAEIGSRAFSNNRLSIKIKGNINWLEQYKADYDQWAKYKSVSASIVYNLLSEDHCRIFVEAGPSLILPNKRFSKRNSCQGLIASTGLEMFVVNTSSSNLCYYFSLGVAYSKATADNLEGQPTYARGLVFANGFRVYF